MPEAGDSIPEVPGPSEGQPPDNTDEGMPPVEEAINTPVPEPGDDELFVKQEKTKKKNPNTEYVFEVGIDVYPEDVTDNELFLWGVLEECFQVNTPKAKRRVEVSFRKLNESDKELFRQAMKKEWQSWIDNKVVSLCKARGISPDRIIKARWVLVWKKSSDPDVKTKTPKARLVLVGWQDPELGRVATDSPTLRKETKSLVLSVCAAQRWTLWGADIKTAFLSGDASCRDIFFKPPVEVQEWMSLSSQDLMRLEKAAYGLAEAPRAWYLRLCREMKETGLQQSKLDPCLFTLRSKSGELEGICGIHVDDLLGGGNNRMNKVLDDLRKRLPFGDFRTFTIRYTGIEIRQCPNTMSIEIGQEGYIDGLEQVQTKPLGVAETPLKDATILRTCAGQLAWVANSTRPDQSFLASYLQGVQDKGHVSHVHMFNKAVREMKERKICLRFPSVPIDKWRIVCLADAGWATRPSGDSQGGYVLCLCTPELFENKRAPTWVLDWSSKKLRRKVRSSVAAETLAGQNGLDAIEVMQALIAEAIFGIDPKRFRNRKPELPAAIVIDSKGFYDAVTRSSCSSAVSLEKRLQIDYAIAKETTEMQNILVFWINNVDMIADVLTKLKGDSKPLFDLLEKGYFQIRICRESGKKEKARKEIEGGNTPE